MRFRKTLLFGAATLCALFYAGALFAQAPPLSIGGSIGIMGGMSLEGQTNILMNDANHTLLANEWWAGTLKVTSSVALTATRQIIAPLNLGQQYNVENSTTGGQSITIIGTSGTGVTIANGKTAYVFSDGTNYVQPASNISVPLSAPLLGSDSLGNLLSVSGVNPLCAGIACPSQNNPNFTTTAPLTFAATSGTSDTTFTVTSTTGFPSAGCAYTSSANGEAFCWAGSTSTTLTGLTRGVYGTTAFAHSIGDSIVGYVQTASLTTGVTPIYVIGNAGGISYNSAAPEGTGITGVTGQLAVQGLIHSNGLFISTGNVLAMFDLSNVKNGEWNGQTGLLSTAKYNSTVYVDDGTVNTFLTIQSAVNYACSTTNIRVIIPAQGAPTDTVAAVTGGCNTVSIEDQRTIPSSFYSNNAGSYVPLMPTVGVAGPNYFFGDSTTANLGAGDSGSSPQMANRLGNDLPGQKFSYAVSGYTTAQITQLVFGNFPVNYNTSANTPKVWIDAGINDANNYGATTGALNNYSLAYNAMVAWIDVPLVNKVYASSATAAGTWANSTAFFLDPSNVGFAKQSSTNGSELTFSIPASGGRVGIIYGIPSAANGGTFTFDIDGTLQTDVCSGTTTFANTGCNSQSVAVNTLFRQDFAVTPGITHTAHVIVNSSTSVSNLVYILAADVTPATKAGQPIIAASGVIRQTADADSAATAAFDTAQQAVYTATQPWASIFRADVRNGTPGVNTTTDMNTGVAGCPGGLTPLHPNSCGYSHWTATVENAAIAAGYRIFFPGSGVNPQTSMGGLQTGGPIVAGQTFNYPNGAATTAPGSFSVGVPVGNATFTAASPNVLNLFTPSATQFAQPTCWFSGPIACAGLEFDVLANTFIDALVSQFEMGFLHCPAAVTTPANCRTDLWTEPTTGYVHTPQGFVGRGRGMQVLTAGTATVSTTAATVPSANATYTLTNCITGGTPGLLSVGTVTAGTSFVINSASATDTSSVCWQIN